MINRINPKATIKAQTIKEKMIRETKKINN
jgi:hypothetical protein